MSAKFYKMSKIIQNGVLIISLLEPTTQGQKIGMCGFRCKCEWQKSLLSEYITVLAVAGWEAFWELICQCRVVI